MDTEKKVKFGRRFYVALKTFHLILQLLFINYDAELFKGDDQDNDLITKRIIILYIIIFSWIILLVTYKKTEFNFITLESITFVIILILLLNTIQKIPKKEKYRLKSDNHTSKLDNPVSNVNPANRVNETTTENLEVTNRYLIGKNTYLGKKAVEYIDSLENSSELNNSLYEEVLPSLPSIDNKFLSATLNETINENNDAISEYSAIQNETINKYAIITNNLTGKTTYLQKKAIKYLDSIDNAAEMINSLYEVVLSGVPSNDYEFLSAASNETLNETINVNNVTMSAHTAIQNESTNEHTTITDQLISKIKYVRKKTIDYVNSVGNSSDIINLLYEILYDIPVIYYEILSELENETANEYVAMGTQSATLNEIVNDYDVAINTNSATPNETIYENDTIRTKPITQNETVSENVTVSTTPIPDPSIHSKKLSRKNVILFVLSTSLVILIIQVVLIIVAFQYRKVLKEHMIEQMHAEYHQTNDGDGEVNIGLMNTENPQNDLEAGPSIDQNNE